MAAYRTCGINHLMGFCSFIRSERSCLPHHYCRVHSALYNLEPHSSSFRLFQRYGMTASSLYQQYLSYVFSQFSTSSEIVKLCAWALGPERCWMDGTLPLRSIRFLMTINWHLHRTVTVFRDFHPDVLLLATWLM